MVKTCVNLIFNSEMSRLKDVLDDVMGCMKNLFPFIADDDFFEIRLIYSELLANAVIHGNKGDSSKYVEITIEVDEEELYTSIRDEGVGFNYSIVAEVYDDDILSEHGRGLMLVNSLTEDLHFSDKGNVVEFRKRIINAGA